MIDSRFGLKYSFPHSLVHIVDNSTYTGAAGVTETYDPSLLTTLVVTGMPMGTDNRIVTVTRSDVLNKAFGAEALTVDDINKYGQAIEYPTSLINQGVPVKLLRITPEGSTYGVSVVYFDWRIINGTTMEARLTQAVEDDLAVAGINLSAYTNPERLAKALFARLKNDNLNGNDDTATDENWHRAVLFAYISAGKGKAYNDLAVYINPPTLTQRKKFANVVYNFGTIDKRYATPIEVERFTAALVNESKIAQYGVVSMMDTVNVQMKKRLEASSIMIPYVNEALVKTIYKKWYELFTINRNRGEQEYAGHEVPYNKIYQTMKDNVDQFDIVFGKFLYTLDGSEYEVNLPYYQIDMKNTDIKLLDKSSIIVEDNFTVTDYNSNGQAIVRTHEVSSNAMSTDVVPTTEDDINNAIFRNKIYPYWNDLYGKNQKTSTTTQTSESFWEDVLLNSQRNHVDHGDANTTNVCKSFTYSGENVDTRMIQDLTSLRSIDKTVPGLMYLTNTTSRESSISVIYSIGQYNGVVMAVTIPRLYPIYKDSTDSNKVKFDKVDEKVIPIKKVISYYNKSNTMKKIKDDDSDAFNEETIVEIINNGLSDSDLKLLNVDGSATSDGTKSYYGSAIAIQYLDYYTNLKKFKLYQVISKNNSSGKVEHVIEYPKNYYAALAWESCYEKSKIHEYIVLKSKVKEAEDAVDGTDNSPVYPVAYYKLGALYIDDVSLGTIDDEYYWAPLMVTQDGTNINQINITSCNTVQLISYFKTDASGNQIPVLYDLSTVSPYRVSAVPTTIRSELITDFSNQEYDYIYIGSELVTNVFTPTIKRENAANNHAGNDGADVTIHDNELIDFISTIPSSDLNISRYKASSYPMSTIRFMNTNVVIPNNYYSDEYGDTPISENGGFDVICGSTGFFDDDELSSVEFKLKYSELLVKAFKGEIDPRILSPARVPAKYLFDAGYNTLLGIRSLPYSQPTIEDYVYASTIFTQDEKEEFAVNSNKISANTIVGDIDVKQAMYDLMIHRCYQGIPENKRPIGPGSGLSLHLDSGFCDIEAIKRMNVSFKSRFTNPNASWDIGGYTSAANGVTYTYIKRLVDHMFDHIQTYTVNKPFVNTYTTITPEEFTSFFPDIDTTDWDLEELLYTSGGNSWVLDESRSLRRKSQRTLYAEETGTSDLLQENNMRTLSQLVYLLQNKIDMWLLEYVDDGILTSMAETINNIFAGWVGTRVQNLNIYFEQDINTDGGEIVVCYVNVTFRGLLLRVPIIVNVNRREV